MKKLHFILLLLIYFFISLVGDFILKAQCNYTVGGNNKVSSNQLSENSIASNPNIPNILLCANNSCDIYGIPNGVTAFVSTNLGINWSGGIIDQGHSYGDPSVSIDLNGRFYVAYLSWQQDLKIAYLDNLGQDWSIKYIVNNSSSEKCDKDHIHTDNSCTSAYSGRIYCAWTNQVFQGINSIQFSYSVDHGNTWSAVIPIGCSACTTAQTGANIATDNNGVVYVIWAIYNNPTPQGLWDNIGYNISTNGGLNWSGPMTYHISNVHPSKSEAVGPSMTVNMLNNIVYVVYPGRVDPNNLLADIYMIKYIYQNWFDCGKVNQDPVNHCIHSFPWISCDPMTGYLSCVYYDTRDNPIPPQNYNTYLSISTNQGLNWCDMKISSITGGKNLYGEYIGVDFNKGIIFPIWSDTRYNNINSFVSTVDVVPRDLTINNQSFNNNVILQCANSITTANNVIINSGANVTFKTGDYILLEPGFQTNQNSTFTAELFNCNNNSDDDNMNIVLKNNVITKKQNENRIPDKFKLEQNYPNPFNPSTLIKYVLKENTYVNIFIYNILGQEVKVLIDEYQTAGYKSVIWDGTNVSNKLVSSGIYFYKIIAGSFIDKKKMVIIR